MVNVNFGRGGKEVHDIERMWVIGLFGWLVGWWWLDLAQVAPDAIWLAPIRASLPVYDWHSSSSLMSSQSA